MGKLLVIPHPAHLNALAVTAMQSNAALRKRLGTLAALAVERSRTATPFGIGPEGNVVSSGSRRARRSPAEQGLAPRLADILDERRAALGIFAALSTASAKGVAQMRTIAAAATPGARYPSLLQRSVAEVLPSLGAIIMDDDSVDRKALEQTAAVYENVLIPLVLPHRQLVEAVHDNQQTASLRAERLDHTPWHLASIQHDIARQKGLTGANVLVGVLDTGIDASHRELAGRLTDGRFAEFDKNGRRVASAPHDKFTHGTHVSALIAGRTVGVAPGATLAVACVLTVSTARGPAGYLTQIARGLDWLLSTPFRGPDADPGVDIVNGSIGGIGYDAFLYTPLAQARLALGTMFIGAIGNSGQYGVNHHGSPGNYDIAVGVGAIDEDLHVAAFSDWGTVSEHPGVAKPDLCAPGCAIWSAVPGGDYERMDGTSMATPLVTGATALLLERDPSLSLSVATLQRQLFALTSTPPSGPRAGRGRLDLSGI